MLLTPVSVENDPEVTTFIQTLQVGLDAICACIALGFCREDLLA